MRRDFESGSARASHSSDLWNVRVLITAFCTLFLSHHTRAPEKVLRKRSKGKRIVTNKSLLLIVFVLVALYLGFSNEGSAGAIPVTNIRTNEGPWDIGQGLPASADMFALYYYGGRMGIIGGDPYSSATLNREFAAIKQVNFKSIVHSNGKIYLADGTNRLSILQPTHAVGSPYRISDVTVDAQIPVDSLVSSDNGYLFAIAGNGRQIAVINTCCEQPGVVRAIIDLDNYPGITVSKVAFDSVDNYLYILTVPLCDPVPCSDLRGMVYKVNLNPQSDYRVQEVALVGGEGATRCWEISMFLKFHCNRPTDIAFNPHDRNLYVINNGHRTVPCPTNNAACHVPNADQTCHPDGSVDVIGGDPALPDNYGRIIHHIENIGKCPSRVAFSAHGDAYVTHEDLTHGGSYYCAEPGRVTVISAFAVKEIINVGLCPKSIAYNSANGNIYVGSSNLGRNISMTISVFSTIYPYMQSFTTELINDSNGQTISHNALVPYGTKIRQAATISLKWDPEEARYYLPPVPTGNIRYYQAGGDCNELIFNLAEGPATIPVSIDPNEAYYILSPGSTPVNSQTVSFLAKYEGNYGSVYASCKSVNVLPPRITTAITTAAPSEGFGGTRIDPGTDVTEQTVPVGTVVRDTAQITPTTSPDNIPKGFVTYQFFNNHNCKDNPEVNHHLIKEWTVEIDENGEIPFSPDEVNLTDPGDFAFMAIYHGTDPAVIWSQGGCERISVR